MQTRLVKKTSTQLQVCTQCNHDIYPDEIYHLEEGVEDHLHSLLARRFCNECYTKFGEKKLLQG